MLASEATPARIRAFCRAQYHAWFGKAWDPSLRPLLLGADEREVDPFVQLAQAPSVRRRKTASRRARIEADERRRHREARAEVGHAITEVVKATQAARAALSRLRSASREAHEIALRRKMDLVVESEDGGEWGAALEAGVDVVEEMLAKLPADLDVPRPPRRAQPRTLIAQRAPAYLDRELAPRELAVVSILAGVAATPRGGDTVASVLERERLNYGQLAMRKRR